MSWIVMVQIGHGVALTLVWPCGVWPWSYDTVGWLVGWLIVWLSDWLHAARRWWKSIESVDCKHRQQCWSVCDGWNHREPVAAGARCHWSPFVHLLQLLKPLLLSSITVSIFHRCKKFFFSKNHFCCGLLNMSFFWHKLPLLRRLCFGCGLYV